jgi:LysM repeat protein
MAMNKVALTDDEMDAVSGGSILPYRVQPGDSLDDIARKYHVTTEQLIKWNHIQNPSVLTVGQQLKIKY